MKKFYILPFFAASLLISCGSAETESETNSTEEVSSDKGGAQDIEVTGSNLYSIDPSTAVVKWTGFKTPEKIGVDGEFKSYTLTGYHDNAASIPDMILDTEITLDVSSTKTGDEARDGKIVNSFFGTMMNTDSIVAKVIGIEGSTEGLVQLEIKMNDVAIIQEAEWVYREDLGMLIFKGVVNIPDWNAQAALDKLTEVCFEKHQGITWSDVEVRANLKVNVSPAEGV